MSEAESKAAQAMLDLVTGGWRAQCVYAAAKMCIPELIGSGTASGSELARATGANEDRLGRLLRLLVAMGVFEQDRSGAYRNTKLSETLMERDESLRGMVLFCGEEFHRAWGRAYNAFLDGRSGFEIEFQNDFYEFLRLHPDVSRRFTLAMKANNVIFRQIPELIDVKSKHIVDLGGGHGELIKNILISESSVTATLLDREGMLEVARRNLSDFVAEERATLVASDLHDGVPADGDVYFLCRLISDISDGDVVELLRKCRRAMKPGGQVVIIERMIPPENVTAMTLLWDLQLSMISNGRYRTTEEVGALLERGGFSVERTANLPMDTFFVVAAPTSEDRQESGRMEHVDA